MSFENLPLDGISTKVERRRVSLKQIILDVTNPRIQYYLDARLNDQITQDQVRLALAESNGQYDKLKHNINVNKGIYNPIWLVPDGEYFKVIEGNTRALIYSELSDEYYNEVEWQSIEAYILPRAINKEQINFIRLEKHLFGQTPWDAYEKARELCRLFTEEDYTYQRLSSLTKLSNTDLKNNILAFSDMQEQYFKNYWKPGEQLKFSYFAEFRSNKKLKQLVKEGKLSLEQFCDLVGQNKFSRGEEVRNLADVWQDTQARELLLRENMDSALEQLAMSNPAIKSKLFERIANVRYGLENMSFNELYEIKSGLYPAKVEEIKSLYNVLSYLLKDIGVLK
jgi:hypothetical protein